MEIQQKKEKKGYIKLELNSQTKNKPEKIILSYLSLYVYIKQS